MTTNKLFWALAVSGFLLATGAQAQAPEVLNPPIKTGPSKKAKKAKAAASARAKFMSGSQDGKKERVARLKRECKGGVDAGACTGYTR